MTVYFSPTYPQFDTFNGAVDFSQYYTEGESPLSGPDTGRQAYSIVPWFRKAEIPRSVKPNMTAFIRALGIECLDFYDYVQPTFSEKIQRETVFHRVESVLKNIDPECHLKLHGSCCSTLFVPGSDMDFAVKSSLCSESLEYALPFAIREFESLGFTDVQVLPCKKLRVIRFTDPDTQMQADIAFDSPSSSRSVEILQKYLDELPVAGPLIAVVKCILKQNGFNVCNGGVCSYGVAEMVIAFIRMREADRVKCDPKFNIKSSRACTPANVGNYFLEFLRHFSAPSANGYVYSPENPNGILPNFASSGNLLIKEPRLLGENYRVVYRFEDMRVLFQMCLAVLSTACEGQEFDRSILGLLINCDDDAIVHMVQRRSEELALIDALSDSVKAHYFSG